MKNFKMFGLIAFLVIISCSDTKENAYLPNTSIVNEWTLINTSGTIAGINHAFPSRTILWKFNENNTLTVINNNTNENLQSGFPSGTYTYNVANNANGAVCNKKITINTTDEFLCITIADTQMDIEQGVADGINYHFEKVQPFTTN